MISQPSQNGEDDTFVGVGAQNADGQRDVKADRPPPQTKFGSSSQHTRAITFEEAPVRRDETDEIALERLPPLSSQPTARRNSMFRNSGVYSREDLTQAALQNLPKLSTQFSVGRNSMFYNLTREDREILGGVEYRSLRVLLAIVMSMVASVIQSGQTLTLAKLTTLPCTFSASYASCHGFCMPRQSIPSIWHRKDRAGSGGMRPMTQ